MSIIDDGAEAYRRHVAWRMAGRPPNKCPYPSAMDIFDAELDKQGVVDRIVRDSLACQWANQALELADPKRLKLRVGQRREFFMKCNKEA